MVFKRSAEQGNRFWLVLVEERILEGAKRRARFWLGLYKDEDCFFISSFLAGKEAKEAGGTYDGSPLPPFQRSTGQSKEGEARKKIPGAGGVIKE